MVSKGKIIGIGLLALLILLLSYGSRNPVDEPTFKYAWFRLAAITCGVVLSSAIAYMNKKGKQIRQGVPASKADDLGEQYAKAMINVFYNGERYLVVSYRKGGELWLEQSVIGSASTLEELAEHIELGLMRSEQGNNLEEQRHYWEVAGYCSFDGFYRKYDLVTIERHKRHFLLKRMTKAYGSAGGYGECELNQAKITHLARATAQALAKTVIGLFELPIAKTSDFREIETLNGNLLYFEIPDEFDFLDLEDGNTDAYQVFTDPANEKNNFAVMIDSGYDSWEEEEIKEKWTQWHGRLSQFQFLKTGGKLLKQVAAAKTSDLMLVSYFYADDEDLVEVTYQIDLHQPKDRIAEIRAKFEALITTTVIDTLVEEENEVSFAIDDKARIGPRTGKNVKTCFHVQEAFTGQKWIISSQDQLQNYPNHPDQQIDWDELSDQEPIMLYLYPAPVGTRLRWVYEDNKHIGFTNYDTGQEVSLAEILLGKQIFG